MMAVLRAPLAHNLFVPIGGGNRMRIEGSEFGNITIDGKDL